ncbi:ubinuclein-2b isoform X2 [Corythoichthys intestinalis]|uniref:ubinuclein-2b isoform X2 n=1 Tax=Corythoichthys intestinalis TaxID=161448 RepID=UPI0025A65C4C|nr:ubinuclein-2b isoform X2 [Corythoichthys intestinalis]
MAEPRKVPFVTLSPFHTAALSTPEVSKKRRREDEAISLGSAFGSEGGGGGFGTAQADAAEPAEVKPTVRLNLSLSEPSERGSAEFNYIELVLPTPSRPSQVQLAAASTVPKGLAPSLDPNDPLADDEKERREVEELARKFENKYGGASKKRKKDRMQDLIDIGYGYDETDPFIDNSEAYDELVPASLTTKHGGFYINTGTLQFRAASDSEGEDTENNHVKLKDGEERVIKKRKKKQDGAVLEEKKPRKNKVPKPRVSSLNRPEKKKRKKLMKDSLHLANMLRRFTREKEEMRKRNVAGANMPRPQAKVPCANSAVVNSQPKAANANDCNVADLTSDPAVMSLLGSANNDVLQDMMGDLDFGMLDSPQPPSPSQGENGSFSTGLKAGAGRVSQGNVASPPSLPAGLPGPLLKRIEDLRAASRQFDEEGRKKFFTMDMNNILLDIDLQVQEQPADVRSVVYSHLEAFVPCNKEGLLKRLKKLSLNIQDDRLRTPLLKLKLAVCGVMPEQIARYNMDCIAKVAKHQSEEGEKNGSEDDDEEKPGKRVMGPRKKFVWDDKLRSLLCSLVRVKLSCYELEGKSTSPEDYLKAFMETEVKPLWPKGWMQGRMLFKESIMAHGHLTGYTAKKKIITTPKAKPKEAAWVQRSTPSAGVTPSPVGQVAKRPSQSPSEPICLDSLDDDLAVPSLDSISQALMILGNAAKGLAQGENPPSPDIPKSVTNPPSTPHVSPLIQQQQKKNLVSTPTSSNSRYTFTSSSPSTPLSRPSSVTFSPVSSVRVDAMGVVKGPGQVHRHSVLNTQRPVGVAVPKVNSPASAPPAKPRPPPTTSPLAPPGSKVGVSTPPSSIIKCSNNKGVNSSDPIIITSPPSRPTVHPSSVHMSPKTFLSTHLPHNPQNKASPSAQSHLGVSTTQQSGFITPMHATITKSSHSGVTPIVKLTPRTLSSATVTPSRTLSSATVTPPRTLSSATTPPRTLSSATTPCRTLSSASTTPSRTLSSTSTASRNLSSAVSAPSRPASSAVSTPSRPLSSAITAPSRPLSSAVTAPSRSLSSAVTAPSRTLSSSVTAQVTPTPSRTLNSVVTTSSLLTTPQIPRSQATSSLQQYASKSPAGFRPPFSGAQAAAAKVSQGAYAAPGSQKSPIIISNSSNTANSSLINTSSITKHSGTGTPPSTPSANPGQRQRPGGLTSQGAKPVTSVPLSSVPLSPASSQLPQVSSAGSSGLLASGPSLPLGFGMLGGLVPVSLPFQFPPLLNLPPLGTSTAPSSSAASSNASFSTLTQNVGQSQGGDAKRKTL